MGGSSAPAPAPTSDGPRSPRISKDPQVRREEFLTAAFKLFQDAGYENTSVQMIADAVGISKGLFYHYFLSKAELLNELVSWQASLFVQSLPSDVGEMSGSTPDKIREITRRGTQWKLEDIRTLSATYLSVMYREENRGLRSGLMSSYSRALIPLVAGIISQGVGEGICHVHDPQLAAELFMAMGMGLNDRFAEIILSLSEHPENIGRLVALMEAFEDGIERLLGMSAGTLQMFDHKAMAEELRRLQDETDPPKG